MRKIVIPAVSRELEFIAKHIDEADDIWDGNVKDIDPLLKRLSDDVYRRAEDDALALLKYLKDCIQDSSVGLRINKWHWPRDGGWEVYSDIFSGTKGRKRRIGWAGLHIGSGKEGFRLIGFMGPRSGGLDGRRRLAVDCKKKIKEVHLTRDDQKRYPGWNDCIIWLDRKLTLRTSRQELETELRRQTKKFFNVVGPLLAAK